MKILLFGGSGQLGHEIKRRGEDLSFEIVSPVISEVSITDIEQIKFLAKQVQPDVIINSAAYTAVDKAEEEQDEAFQVNRDGAASVALAAKEVGVRLVHISTDYVFDGSARAPVAESATPNPINVYGASKLAGEKEIENILGGEEVIVRTSSLHGKNGQNFVHTMLRLFDEREEVSVVNDQIMSPTWAGWLGGVILDLCRIQCRGVVHACCAGEISWFDFAQQILEYSRDTLENAEKTRVLPIGSEAFPRPAKRPHYSVLDTARLSELLGRKPIEWKVGLASHLREIGHYGGEA